MICGFSACASGVARRKRATIVFERGSHNSPVGIIFLMMRHWLEHGNSDIFSGLPMDMSCWPCSPRKPTLCAHRVHHVPFHFGFDRPFPDELAHFDGNLVKTSL